MRINKLIAKIWGNWVWEQQRNILFRQIYIDSIENVYTGFVNFQHVHAHIIITPHRAKMYIPCITDYNNAKWF